MNLPSRLPLIILAALLYSAFPTSAQDTTGRAQTHYHQNNLLIKATPLSIFDWWGALLPVGLEYNILDKFSIIGEVGIPLYTNFTNGDRNEMKINGDIKIRGELRCYVTNNPDFPLFIGAECFYRHQSITQTGKTAFYYGKKPLTIYSYTSGLMTKNVTGTGLLVGVRIHSSKRSNIEVHLGLGKLNFTVSHSNLENVTESYSWKLLWGAQNHIDGSDYTLYVPFGIKYSYSLFKKYELDKIR